MKTMFLPFFLLTIAKRFLRPTNPETSFISKVSGLPCLTVHLVFLSHLFALSGNLETTDYFIPFLAVIIFSRILCSPSGLAHVCYYLKLIFISKSLQEGSPQGSGMASVLITDYWEANLSSIWTENNRCSRVLWFLWVRNLAVVHLGTSGLQLPKAATTLVGAAVIWKLHWGCGVWSAGFTSCRVFD